MLQVLSESITHYDYRGRQSPFKIIGIIRKGNTNFRA